ncbi:MAG: hypothetical protein AAF581_07745 [Planctomycetota bacterium]
MRSIVLSLPLLLLAGCMTHLEVCTQVYQPPLLASPEALEEAGKELEQLYVRLETRAQKLFEAEVSPLVDTFGDVFSERARDPEVFASKVADRVRKTSSEEYQGLLGVLAQVKSTVRASSKTRCRSAVAQFPTKVSALRTRLDAAIDTAVTARASANYRDVLDDYLAAETWLQQFLADQKPAALATLQAQEAAATMDQLEQLAATRLQSLAKFQDAEVTAQNLGGLFADLRAQSTQIQSKVRGLIVPLQESSAAAVIGPIDIAIGALDLSDPTIPTIIEDHDNWKSYVNDVDAKTFIGNSEIAIKMETIGQYHLKGVTVDNNGAAEAAFDVLGQAISVLAAAYGMPIPVGAGSGDGNSDAPAALSASGPSLRAQALALNSVNIIRGERMTQLFLNGLTLSADLPGPPSNPPTAAEIKQLDNARNQVVQLLNSLAGKIEKGH